MIGLRQILIPVAVGTVALMYWGQHYRLEQAAERLQHLEARSHRQAATIIRLGGEVQAERAAQVSLRTTQNQLRQSLTHSLTQLQELEHENAELRDWSRQSLPDAARRLRERPAITGAADYRDWLSRRRALQPATHVADQ